MWVDGILASMGDKRPATLRLIDFVDAVEEELSPGMEEDHDDAQGGGHEYDEHIWTSPRNAVKLVDAVSAAMAGADPDNAEIYKTNGKKYGDAIAALDDQFRQMIQSATRRKIVVGDKFPFRYFVDEYGLSYAAAFPACSTESDCSAATMAYLVDYIKSEQIPVIYTIELSTQTVAKALAEETGAQILTLQSCHNVTVKDFEAGATYLSLMTQNLDNLRKGLA